MKTIATYGVNLSSVLVPLIAIFHSLVLFALSKNILLPLFGIDSETDEGRATSVCCAFNNAGVVPLIFSEALFRHDEPSKLNNCYAQISLYLAGWSPVFWSFGRNVLIGNHKEHSPSSGKSLSQKVQNVAKLFPPPVIATLIGVFIALSPLQSLFMSSSEKRAPLSVVYNSLQNFGRAASPLSLLVLTSSLAIGAGMNANISESTTFQTKTEVSLFRRWAVLSLTRFVLSPLLMLTTLKSMAKMSLLKSADADPMLWFVLILESCMPPAQNSVLMLQVANMRSAASSMAKFLFSIYMTSMIPIVIIVSYSIHALRLQ